MGSLRVGHDYTTSLSLFTFHFHTLEKEMATRSSVLAWRIPGTGGAWWAAVYGVAQNWTRLKRLSSSSSRSSLTKELSFKFYFIITNLNLNSHTISQLHFKKISNISPLKQISVQCSYSVLSDSLRPP